MATVKSKSESNNTAKAAPASTITPAEPKHEAASGTATPEQRYQMIAEAAYFRAEKRCFSSGDPANDWLEAEAEIDRILQQPSGLRNESLLAAKQAFQQKLEAQLKEWDTKLNELKAKAQAAKNEIRADYEKQIEILSGKRESVQAKMTELRQRTEYAWEDLKGGTEKAWEDMREALDRIATRFK